VIFLEGDVTLGGLFALGDARLEGDARLDVRDFTVVGGLGSVALVSGVFTTGDAVAAVADAVGAADAGAL